MTERKNWTREEEMLVLEAYCEIPFKNSSKTHPKVIEVANLVNHSPSAVNMKIGNFGSFDIALKQKGIVGLSNVSKLDRAIWEEFNNKWDKLTEACIQIKEEISKNNAVKEISVPNGREKTVVAKQRVNQDFFRRAVLSSYNNCCCITGLTTSQLLIASHIKPWKESDESEKTNPTNGLCLNSLHDRAFDKGFITVDEKYVVHVSNDISDAVKGKTVNQYFKFYDGEKIILPDRFLPSKEYLQYHNDVVFECWK